MVSLKWCLVAACVLLLATPLWAQNDPTLDEPAADTPAASAPAAPSAPKVGLPPGFVAPREVPDVLTLEKELMTAQEEKEFQPERLKYQKALHDGSLGGGNRALIDKGARWRIYRMTRPANRRDLGKLREDVTRTDLKQWAEKDAREYLLEQVTQYAGELLASNEQNFYVRYNLVVLLSELTLKNGMLGKNEPDVAYAPAADPLIAVLNDENQLAAIKLAAVQGLTQICRTGEPITGDMRFRIANAMATELEKTATLPDDPTENHWWYQMRLAEGLGATQVLHDRARRPFVIDVLAKTLADTKRHWLVRAEAAKALGRVPLGGGGDEINVSLLVFEIANLGLQMSQAQKQNPDAVYWKPCFFNLYLAFKPLNASEKEKGAGLLTRPVSGFRELIEGAYADLLPLIQNVLGTGNSVNVPDQLQKVSQWLEENRPKNFSVAPRMPPINMSATPSAQTPAAQTPAAQTPSAGQQAASGSINPG